MMSTEPVAPNQASLGTPFEGLSTPARKVWAKYDRRNDGWLPLRQHMLDSAAVAGQLWDVWLPESVKRLIANPLPEGMADGRRLVVWLAAVHDGGKASPAFACQVDAPLAQAMRDVGLEMRYQRQFGDDRKLAPHGLAGQLLLQEWLSERYGWSNRVSGQFAIVAGGHHGVPPGHQRIHDLLLHPELIRTPGPSEALWKSVQFELLDACARAADVDERLPSWKTAKLPQPVQVLLTAVVILSDWVASSSELFPHLLVSPGGSVAHRSIEERLAAAWRGLDLPTPWAPDEPSGTAADLFASRFDLPEGATIRPVQEAAVRVAREMDPAGLLIIEAPMGEGKTEAALAAAEILAARTGAGGCMVALPTRATGDAMFTRLLEWLKHLPNEGERSVFLAHAKAALNDKWAGLVRKGNRTIAAVDSDGPQQIPAPGARKPTRPSGLQAHQWLRGRKKGLLASFSVGTIDQVLFAALRSRHLALRHLALAGKVVVIDEVHAYDAYMNVYLERVLEWLSAYRVPVVLLSATLPAARRRALAAAYAGGNVDVDLPDEAYPLLTSVARGGAVRTEQPSAASGRRIDIRVEACGDDLQELTQRLDTELVDGGCVLVVRNTVDRVLETAERLRERFGNGRVLVAHSRFVAADRARRDAELLSLFGPGVERPAGPYIVVASQVVEQSLDLDFDLLVTDLAPMDLVLQRMGRLHRHTRTRPQRLRTPRCLVTGVDWESTPPDPVRGSIGVYQGRYLLLRSLAVLRPYLDGRPLRLPEDISPLVQAVYGKHPLGPEGWAAAMDESQQEYHGLLADKRERAEAFRLGPVRRAGRPVIGWVDAGVGDADDTPQGRAQVRDSDETIEVLVIRRSRDGVLTTLPWLDKGRGGLELPEHAPPPRRAAEAVAASALSLPWHFSKPWVIDAAIGELEQFCVDAWQSKECPWLAGELFLVLDEDCQTRLAGFDVRYSQSDGLLVTPVGARDARVVDSVASFDLVSRPWLPVQYLDGTMRELSLRGVFAEAGRLRRLVGDVPTQEFALLRLLLAVLHDAVGGPEDVHAWGELWESDEPFADVPDYLDRHRDRFDLLHPHHPFFQVADLRTAKDEVAPLNRIVADVPNGDPFFSMRRPGPEKLSFAEAARWLVHAHAFDVSGIKSGAVGDPRVKGGKGYPQGVGWAGNLGGVYAEGHTLRDTLLLNLVSYDNDFLESNAKRDLPVWRRPLVGAAPIEPDLDDPRPSGPRDLYTWQSRRIRLHVTDGVVTGVVLAYGDPLSTHNKYRREPMSGWRRSPFQEKKLRRSPIYLPRSHDPARAVWRGLAALLEDKGQGRETAEQRQEGETTLSSGVVKWLARLTSEEDYLPPRTLLRTRVVGALYGTQQSVIDEIVDDHIPLPVVLLHRELPDYGQAAVDAVADADGAVRALGHLAGNLARAVGGDPGPAVATARDLGFAQLDGQYRQWLSRLGDTSDPHRSRADWQATVDRTARTLGHQLLDDAGPAASEGRYVEIGKGEKRWVDDAQADLWFRRALRVALPLVEYGLSPGEAEDDDGTDGSDEVAGA